MSGAKLFLMRIQPKTALCNTHSCHTTYPWIDNTQDFVFTRRRKQTPISIPRHGKYGVVMATDDVNRLRLLNVPEKALKIWQKVDNNSQMHSLAVRVIFHLDPKIQIQKGFLLSTFVKLVSYWTKTVVWFTPIRKHVTDRLTNFCKHYKRIQ